MIEGLRLLGSLCKASGSPQGAAGVPGADLARGLAKPQYRTLGVELHLP